MRVPGAIALLLPILLCASSLGAALPPLGFTSHLLSTREPIVAFRDFERERAKLETELVPKLMEQVDRANTLKAYATRNKLYRMILTIDSENSVAWRGLKYRRVDDKWVAPEKRREPKDPKSKRAKKLVAEVDGIVAEYFEVMLNLVEKHAAEIEDEELEFAYRRLLLVVPDHPRVHELLREEKLGERWVMRETASAFERRATLTDIARKSYASVSSLEKVEPGAFEQNVKLPWTVGYQTSRVQVFGTGDSDEIEQIARASHAMGALVLEAFGKEIALSRHHAIYSLANRGEEAILLRSLPGSKQGRGPSVEGATGGWLEYGSRFGTWAEDVPRRVDAATRATVSQYLQNGFQVSLHHGWASEGIGLYMVEQMVGTRLTWFMKKDRYVIQGDQGNKEAFNIENNELNWMQAARDLLTSEDPPSLGLLIGRRVGTMSSQDLVHAYVLAAYLIEGRPNELPLLLKAIGRNGNPTRTFESVLGETLPEIEQRLMRWAVEREGFELKPEDE